MGPPLGWIQSWKYKVQGKDEKVEITPSCGRSFSRRTLEAAKLLGYRLVHLSCPRYPPQPLVFFG